jgi:hypothetical protein
MTDPARALMIAKIQFILHLSLVEIRNLARSDVREQIHDLADTVEFLPFLLLRWDDEQANLVRPSLCQYETKYPRSAGRYTCILDMEEEKFNEMYRPGQYAWDMDDATDTFSDGEVTT